MMCFLLCCPPYFGTMEADKGEQIMAEKRISSAEKRIMDRGQIPWKDELRQIIDIARERTKDLQM